MARTAAFIRECAEWLNEPWDHSGSISALLLLAEYLESEDDKPFPFVDLPK